MTNLHLSTDDGFRVLIYENLRHQAYTAWRGSSDLVEARIFEIEYNRYDDLIRMIKGTPEMLCPFHRASVIKRRRLGLDHGIRQSSAEREADRAAGRDA